jgi:hypothetical protein
VPLVRSPYGTPDHPLTPEPSRTGIGRLILGLVVMPALAISTVAIVGEHLTAPDPHVAVQSGIGFAVHDGSELVLVPYERISTGEGPIAEVTSDMFQVRIAAVDVATGEGRWDVQLSDGTGWRAAVVAAGERYAYLATDDGFQVRSLDDGSMVAEPGDIAGLAGAQSVSPAAYGYDPAIPAVVALDVNGGIHTIALDTLEAVPADEATAAAWSGRLFAQGAVPDLGGVTTTEAPLADGDSTVRVQPTAAGALGATLIVRDADGADRTLNDRVFYDAAIVLDQTIPTTTASIEAELDDIDDLVDDFLTDPEGTATGLIPGLGRTAAGAASGHVLVEHRTEPGAEAYALHVIELDTGRVTASIDTASRLGRAVTSPSGRTAVIAAPAGGDSFWMSDLVLVAPDGSIDRCTFGELDFFGDPVL